MLTLQRCARSVRAALLLLPVITCALWLGSGRETFTKPARAVEVEVKDDVFGDTEKEIRLIRGPIIGHYVGLDAVAATVILSSTLLASAGLLRRFRRRNRRDPGKEGA